VILLTNKRSISRSIYFQIKNSKSGRNCFSCSITSKWCNESDSTVNVSHTVEETQLYVSHQRPVVFDTNKCSAIYLHWSNRPLVFIKKKFLLYESKVFLGLVKYKINEIEPPSSYAHTFGLKYCIKSFNLVSRSIWTNPFMLNFIIVTY